MASGTLHVRVVSPTEVVFEGEALSVVAPAFDGKVGILPGHAPLITILGGGELDLDLEGAATESFFVNRGALKVEDDQVTILTEYAGREAPPDYDPSSAWIEETDLKEASDPANPLA